MSGWKRLERVARAHRRYGGDPAPWLQMRLRMAAMRSYERRMATRERRMANLGGIVAEMLDANTLMVHAGWEIVSIENRENLQPGDPLVLTLEPTRTVRVPPGAWRVVGTHGPSVTLETFDAFAADVRAQANQMWPGYAVGPDRETP